MVIRNVAKVLSVKHLSPTVYYIEVQPEEKFEYKSGQYMIIQVDVDGQLMRRSYSIASKKDEPLAFCIKKTGPVSNKLGTMKPGDEVTIIGPAGMFFRKTENNPEVYIATGTGIAPFRAMIAESKNPKKLLFGAKTASEIIFKKEFEKIPDLEFIPCTSQEKTKNHGRVSDFVKKLISKDNTQYYICGVKDMVLDTLAVLEKEGVERKNIHFERYS